MVCFEPLPFIIYMDDIADKLISLCRLFADDTSFNISSQSIEHIKNVVDQNWQDWITGLLNGSFNPEKTNNYVLDYIQFQISNLQWLIQT